MINIKCALCGKDDYKIVAKGHDRYVAVDSTTFQLVKCNNCNLYYLSPQPTKSELAKYYPISYPPFTKTSSFLNDGVVTKTLKSIKNRIFPRKSPELDNSDKPYKVDNTKLTVLDFGCGNGNNLLSIRSNHPNWSLYGFDIGENTEVKNIGSDITIIYDDFNKLSSSFKNDYFDMIYMNNVLEHMNDPVKVIGDLSLLLKKGGQIIIEVPNIDSIKFKIFGRFFSSLDIPRHLYNFSPKTLTMVCEKNGLKITNIKITGSPKSTARSIYYMLGIRKQKINSLFMYIVNKITKVIGEKRINDDVIIATVTK